MAERGNGYRPRGTSADDVLVVVRLHLQNSVESTLLSHRSSTGDRMQIVDTASTGRLFNPVKGGFLDEGDAENTSRRFTGIPGTSLSKLSQETAAHTIYLESRK